MTSYPRLRRASAIRARKTAAAGQQQPPSWFTHLRGSGVSQRMLDRHHAEDLDEFPDALVQVDFGAEADVARL